MSPLRTTRCMRPTRRVHASITPADLPTEIVALLYMLVDVPFTLRATCKALRDAQPDGTIEGPMLSPHLHGYKTKTALVDVVKDVRLLAWACESGCVWHDRLATFAARAGREEAINYLREFEGYEWDVEIPKEAASGGHLETLKWLHEKRRPGEVWGHVVCDAAAEQGHLEVMRFAFETCGSLSFHGFDMAASGGHYECVEYALAQTKTALDWNPKRSRAAKRAASNGHIRILELLQKHHFPASFKATAAAAGAAGSDCFLFLVNEAGYPWEERDCLEAAARAGNMDVLRWIIDHTDAPHFWDSLLVLVAYEGKAEVLQLAYDTEPLDFNNAYLCEAAALGGHLELLRWLRSVECPFGSTMLEQAADGGHLHVLEWLWEQEVIEHHRHSFDGAINDGHIPALKWAMEKGLPGPWTEGATPTLPERASQLGNLDVIKWAVSLGHELTPQAVYDAATWNHVCVLKWLVEVANVPYDWDRLNQLYSGHKTRGSIYEFISMLQRRNALMQRH